MRRLPLLITLSVLGLLTIGARPACDPSSGGPGTVIAENEAPVVDSRFLDLAAGKDALLASAIWGAMDQETDARGVFVQTHFAPGAHTGTMGTQDHRSFKYTVDARQPAPTMLILRVALEEERTGAVQRYEGALFHSGLQGELVRLSDDGSHSPVVVWDFRPKPDGQGKDPRPPQ